MASELEKIRKAKGTEEYRMILNCQFRVKRFADTKARDYVLGLLENRRKQILRVATQNC